MRFGILGPLEVTDDQVLIPIPAAKQRAVLAILLLHANSTVPGWQLIEELWAEPPVSARKVVQTYVSKLRHVLEPGLLTTRATGYRLNVDLDDIDFTRFERLVAEAHGAAPQDEAARLREALGLWRGRALEDFTDEAFAQPHIVHLENLRLTAFERRIAIELAEGRHDLVLDDLTALVHQNSLNERLRGQLMVALYGSGRQSEALSVYLDGRRLLIEQLGVEPTPALRRLQEAILRQDPALELPDPPIASATAHRPLLVAGSSGFVGRSEELTRLCALVLRSDVRLVTLMGAAGVGKTRLAVELMHHLSPGLHDQCDQVDLSKVTTPDGVSPAICSTLGLHPADLRDSATVLAGFLESRVQLLVLDNFEHVLPAAATVATLLASSPGLTVVVTSRAALGIDGEHVVEVEPLDLPALDLPLDLLADTDAVRLFVERARLVRPDFVLTESTAPPVAQLCTHLDGLPLAIELAAARIDVLSPRAILSRLGDRLDLLATDAPLLPERHRSLRAAVEWSFDLLDVDAQLVFSELSAFAGGFTIDTAERVVTKVRSPLVDVVKALIRVSLLRSKGAPGDEPRFGMLETVREYGLARLTESGRAGEIRSAHAQAFCALAEEAEPQLRGPDQVRWLDLLDAELANVRETLRWASSGGDPDTGLLVAVHLWRYWQMRGLTHEARAYLEAALATESGSRAARAAGHLGVARCAFQQGDLPAVRDHIRDSLPFHRQQGDRYSSAFGLMLLGAATGRSGDAEAGETLLRAAMELAAASRDSWLQACCLGYLGMVSSGQGEHTKARFALEEGLRGVRELGDARLVGWFLIGLGRTALAANDTVRAQRRFQEALDWQRRVADDWSEAWALQGLAGVALLTHEHQTSLALAIESLTPARRAHSRPAIAGVLHLLARLAHAHGRAPLAATLLGAKSVLSAGRRELWASEIDGIAVLDAATLAETLEQAALEEHWAAGRALTTDQAVTLATKTLSPLCTSA